MGIGVVSAVEQLIRDGRFSAALAECNKALEGDHSKNTLFAVLQLKARVLVTTDGKWTGPAMSCLKEAMTLTEPGSQERGQIFAAQTAGYAGMGCLGPCLRARNDFVTLYEAKPTPLLAKLYPDVEYNLALAYHEVDRIDEAESTYLIALGAARKSDDPYVRSLLPVLHHNLVDIFQEVDRFEHAKLIMDKWYRELSEDTYGAQMRNRRAIQDLHEGDLTSALLWAESGLGHKSCDVRTRAALTLTKAKILEAGGQADEAHDICLEALRLAALAKSPRLSHRVSSFIQELSKGV